jgi:hypothetical protein
LRFHIHFPTFSRQKTLVKILGNRTKAQLCEIAMAYGRHHKNSLEKDLRGDCSGNFLALQLELIKHEAAP